MRSWRISTNSTGNGRHETGGMRVRPIHFVPDVDEAIRFYEALGLPCEARARGTGHWAELAAAGGELGLHDAALAADGAGRDGIQLGFVAEEPLEAVATRLRAAGFPPEGEIVDQEWGRSLLVPGPGGLLVQIDEQHRDLYT
jgi:catechol 2,3-dioxygenase-like lactoylglutathione lyase family enzyme